MHASLISEMKLGCEPRRNSPKGKGLQIGIYRPSSLMSVSVPPVTHELRDQTDAWAQEEIMEKRRRIYNAPASKSASFSPDLTDDFGCPPKASRETPGTPTSIMARSLRSSRASMDILEPAHCGRNLSFEKPGATDDLPAVDQIPPTSELMMSVPATPERAPSPLSGAVEQPDKAKARSEAAVARARARSRLEASEMCGSPPQRWVAADKELESHQAWLASAVVSVAAGMPDTPPALSRVPPSTPQSTSLRADQATREQSIRVEAVRDQVSIRVDPRDYGLPGTPRELVAALEDAPQHNWSATSIAALRSVLESVVSGVVGASPPPPFDENGAPPAHAPASARASASAPHLVSLVTKVGDAAEVNTALAKAGLDYMRRQARFHLEKTSPAKPKAPAAKAPAAKARASRANSAAASDAAGAGRAAAKATAKADQAKGVMPCTRHELAVRKAAQPQPSFRTHRARLSRGWEQSVGSVAAGYVYRTDGHGGTKSGTQHEWMGPGSFENDHKDRFGGLTNMGDRSRTLWHLA